MTTNNQHFSLHSADELSDNQLDEATGGEINLGFGPAKVTLFPSSGNDGWAAFWSGFMHGLTH
jgi:hypothetical protein